MGRGHEGDFLSLRVFSLGSLEEGSHRRRPALSLPGGLGEQLADDRCPFAGNVPESEEWRPHVSIAYSNTTGPTAPYIEALSRVVAGPARLLVASVELIVLNRDNRMYEWQTFDTVALGGQAT